MTVCFISLTFFCNISIVQNVFQIRPIFFKESVLKELRLLFACECEQFINFAIKLEWIYFFFHYEFTINICCRMIKELIIRDFFSFKGEHIIKLNTGVNILVGVNGSGKTSFLNAITMLHEGIAGGCLSALFRQWGTYNAIVNACGAPGIIAHLNPTNLLSKDNELKSFCEKVNKKL